MAKEHIEKIIKHQVNLGLKEKGLSVKEFMQQIVNQLIKEGK